MLENPQLLQEMVARQEHIRRISLRRKQLRHLCSKCELYAEEWQPNADRLWNQKVHPEHRYERTSRMAIRRRIPGLLFK